LLKAGFIRMLDTASYGSTTGEFAADVNAALFA
jgi:hypothetical protein